jgi:hypothetical protein
MDGGAPYEKLHSGKLEELKRVYRLDRLKADKFQRFANNVDKLKSSEILKLISCFNKSSKKSNGSLNCSKESLANYKEHFRKMTKNNMISSELVSSTSPHTNSDLQNTYVLFHPSQLSKILFKLAWNKTPDLSGISSDVFKTIGQLGAEFLSKLFKLYFSIGLIPSNWKQSRIVPVPKKGALTKIENYRSISLLEATRKIFEHCILKELMKVSRISNLKAGIQPGHCCND